MGATNIGVAVHPQKIIMGAVGMPTIILSPAAMELALLCPFNLQYQLQVVPCASVLTEHNANHGYLLHLYSTLSSISSKGSAHYSSPSIMITITLQGRLAEPGQSSPQRCKWTLQRQIKSLLEEKWG